MEQREFRRIKRARDIYEVDEPMQVVSEVSETHKVSITNDSSSMELGIHKASTPNCSNPIERESRGNAFGQEDSFEVRQLKQLVHVALENGTFSDVIGVFGIHSDEVIAKVLQQLEGNYALLGVQQSRLIANVYEQIGAAIMNYMQNQIEPQGISPGIHNRIYELVQDLYVKHRMVYERNESFTGLELMARSTIIDQNCRELLQLARQVVHLPANKKFVFCLEVDMEDFHCNLLRDIQKIQSPDLVMIVSSLAPSSMLMYQLEQEANGFEHGELLFQKFFSPVNCIYAES
ncbi:MAG: hypothetical protein IJ215_01045 [Clostridia bacterium]|nr:hypothetical protein [Clostridia bacterium]